MAGVLRFSLSFGVLVHQIQCNSDLTLVSEKQAVRFARRLTVDAKEALQLQASRHCLMDRRSLLRAGQLR